MRVAPNQTEVRARVKQVTPASDGYGYELELEVLANESPVPALDFLRPRAGDRLTVFSASSGTLGEGEKIRATLGLLAGPFGERAVLRQAELLRD